MAHIALSHPGEVADVLKRIVSAKTDPDGKHNIEALMHDGQCWKIDEDGNVVGACITKVSGDTLWITAAVGSSEDDLTDLIADFLARQSAGVVKHIAFRTARAGLVKKVKKHGYRVTEYWMKKTL